MRLSAALKTYQGVPYVSLSQLAEELGGRVRLDGSRVEVTLGSARAVGAANDTTVAAGQAQFNLAHPILTDYENAFVSVEDATKLFGQGFQVTLRQDNPPAPQTVLTPSTPEEAPPESDNPKELMSTLELPAPPAANAPAEQPATEPSPAAPPVTVGPETAAPAAPALPEAPKGAITVVALDAGHGGADTGTMSPSGTAEKAIDVAVAARFEKALAAPGALTAVIIRKEDREMSFSDRAAAAGAAGAGLIVSLHTGAALSPQAPVVQIYHNPVPAEGGDAAVCAARAKAVADAMAKALAAGDNAPATVVRAVPLRLQAAARIPSVLVELGTLNQADGEAMLLSEDQRGALADRVGAALAEAVAAVNAQK